MIKSLLESDDKQPEEIKIEREEKTSGASAIDENFESHFAGIESPPSERSEPDNLLEISEAADDELIFSEKPKETTPIEPFAETTDEPFNFSEPHFNQPENSFAETKNYEPVAEIVNERTDDKPLAGFPIDEINYDLPGEATIEKPDLEPAGISNEIINPEPPAEIASEPTNFELPAQTATESPKPELSDMLFQPPAERESFAETARKSGLAYAAAITLFASVVFMLIIGWFADLLLGSSPWGIVGGIVLGAVIGFFQFFRLTSQIFRNRD